MLNKFYYSLFVLFIVFAGTNKLSYSQNLSQINDKGDIENLKLEHFKLKAQSFEHFFSRISLHYDIPIGLETAVNDNELQYHEIDFKGGSLTDLLNRFIVENDQYDWQIQDGAVNVFPKNKFRDSILSEMVQTKIGIFTTKENTSCWGLTEALVNTPQIKEFLKLKGIRYAQRGFSGGYIPQVGKNFAISTTGQSLKSILNKIVVDSPIAKFWIIRKNTYDPSIFFITIDARQESSLPGQSIDSLDIDPLPDSR